MGRELRRKQAKKEGKSLKKEIPTEEHQIKKLIMITALLIIIVGLIYLLSALFITKELDWFNNNNEEVTESLPKNTILASEILKQKGEEYYVYFYDFDDEDSKIATVVNKITDLTVYKVDTGSALNNKYVSEESNKSAKKVEELKVKASTVVKVSGETIVAYYENEEIETNLGK